MIQLQQLLTQIIAFLIMLWILKRWAWKPLLAILEARRERIKSQFAEIERQKVELQKTADEYENKLYRLDEASKQVLNEAQKKGKEHARELMLEAQGQARGIINKALLDAEREALKVKESLKNSMADEAVSMTEKLIRKKFSPEEQKSLAKELLNEVK
jgi:F-type H+-transporting ATPase subunit b